MPGIEDLMSALSSDKALSDKLSAASSPDAAVEIAKAAGYQISVPELMEAYKTKMASMSEAELANISGGKGATYSGQQQSGNNTQSGDNIHTFDGNDGNTAGG